MQTVYGRLRPYKLGNILRNCILSRAKNDYCARGPLPWEKCSKPGKQTRKRKVQTFQNTYIPHDCDVLKRPKKNTYEWVIDDENPCKPFGLKKVVDKTICELRRIKNCMHLFGDPDKCEDLTPECHHIEKTYPIMDTLRKCSLPGCARSLPPSSTSKK